MRRSRWSRRLADAGTLVVAVIHQPSTDVFHEFDKVMVLDVGDVLGVASYFVLAGAPNRRLVRTVAEEMPEAYKDVADVVEYLCSERAGYLTGQRIVVDGGAGSVRS